MRTTNEQSKDTSRTYVWDIVVRVFHWTTLSCFVLAYLLEDNRDLHKFFGYTLLTALLIRLVWGIVGSYHARFVNFIPSPKNGMRYAAQMATGKEPRYLGHNPAGAVMIVALILALMSISATGWMMGLDRYWGEEWVEDLHSLAVDFTFVLIFLHVLGVIYSSFKHKENLILSMITGWKTLK